MKVLVWAAIILLPLRGQDLLPRARQLNLERARTLPNFVADEIAKRYQSRHVKPLEWQFVDDITAEIAVQGGRGFTRQNTLVNGKPWNKPFTNFNWGVVFGYELKPLFDVKCNTKIEFDGREESHGKPVLAYRFQSPPNGCFGVFSIKNGFLSAKNRYNPARKGRFLIEDPGGALIRFEEEATEFPKGFGADAFKQTVTWDYVTIGDASYLLPVAYEIFGGFTRAGLWHVLVEYKNHRHFEASTNITFQPENQ